MTAKILSPNPENIQLAARAIQRHEVIGMPTETVYGLAGSGRSPEALARIFKTKERPTFDPLIIHVGPEAISTHELEKLKLIDGSQFSKDLTVCVNSLIHHFWPGPLTLVLPKHPDVPDLATSGLPTVALRMPQHPVAQALIAAAGVPLAAPSANRFGRISPTTPEAVVEELGDRIDWILDGGPCVIGLESTVIGFHQNAEAVLLRPGGTPLEKIEEIIGRIATPSSPSKTSVFPSNSMPSPGMGESHYAPKKPFHLLPKRVTDLTSADIDRIHKTLQGLPPQSLLGLLILEGEAKTVGQVFSQKIGHPVVTHTLSPTGNLDEAAYHLFGEMRKLDSSPAILLFSEPCPLNFGLSYAIQDRLKRASAKK